MENPEVKVEVAQPEVTDDDKLWGLLSWLLAPIVPIVVLVLEDKKNRPFIKFHAMNALAVVIIGWVISGLLSAVIVGCFTGIALLVYQIYMAIMAYQGKWVEVPGITGFLKSQGLI